MGRIEFVIFHLSLAVFLVETILYLIFTRWYFTLGPSLHTQHWQTAASVEETAEAVDRACSSLKLAVRRRGSIFLMRFKWWEMSTWPRLVLRVTPGPHGAILTYEVRPFVSPALVVIAIVVLFRSGWLGVFSFGYLLFCILMYIVGWWYETRKLKSLKPLRDQLAQLGLTICSKCGYDRFRLPSTTPCPECGHEERPPTAQTP